MERRDLGGGNVVAGAADTTKESGDYEDEDDGKTH